MPQLNLAETLALQTGISSYFKTEKRESCVVAFIETEAGKRIYDYAGIAKWLSGAGRVALRKGVQVPVAQIEKIFKQHGWLTDGAYKAQAARLNKKPAEKHENVVDFDAQRRLRQQREEARPDQREVYEKLSLKIAELEAAREKQKLAYEDRLSELKRKVTSFEAINAASEKQIETLKSTVVRYEKEFVKIGARQAEVEMAELERLQKAHAEELAKLRQAHEQEIALLRDDAQAHDLAMAEAGEQIAGLLKSVEKAQSELARFNQERSQFGLAATLMHVIQSDKGSLLSTVDAETQWSISICVANMIETGHPLVQDLNDLPARTRNYFHIPKKLRGGDRRKIFSRLEAMLLQNKQYIGLLRTMTPTEIAAVADLVAKILASGDSPVESDMPLDTKHSRVLMLRIVGLMSQILS